MDKEFDLNAPAFAEEEQEALGEQQVSNSEEKKEEVSGSTEEEPVGDKPRIPYSRFEKVHEEKIRAEEQARIYKEQLDALNQKPSGDDNAEYDTEKELWIGMHGDSEESMKFFEHEQNRLKRIEEEAPIKALEALKK